MRPFEMHRDRVCVQGLELLAGYEFIAVFDADFKPAPDFLVRSHSLEMSEECDVAAHGAVHTLQ